MLTLILCFVEDDGIVKMNHDDGRGKWKKNVDMVNEWKKQMVKIEP